MHATLTRYDYAPGDYGVKILISAVVEIDGCFGCEIEGYVLSEAETPDIMDVTLIKSAPYDFALKRRIGEDRPGPSLSVGDLYSQEDREFFHRHLMREAKTSKVRRAVEDAWHNWKAWADLGAEADACRARGWAA